MAKKFKAGKCAHCGNYFDELTSDHVFPKSWYPESTPNNMEKWQMPSCIECNRRYSKIENDLLIRLGLGLAPNEFDSLGITDKVMRAMTPEYGKNEKDKKLRQSKREQILKQMLPASQFDENNFLPGLNDTFGMGKDKLFAMTISPDDIKALGEKIIKGVTYVLKDKILDDDYKVEILFVNDSFNTQILDVIKEHTFDHHRGPGIRIGIATPDDCAVCGLFEILIWGKIKFYGVVLPV